MRKISFKLLIYTITLVFILLALTLFFQRNIITDSYKANQKNKLIQYVKNISDKFKNDEDYLSEADNISSIINGRVSIYDSNSNLIASYGRFMFGRTRNMERQIISDVLSGKNIYQTDQKTLQGSTVITLGMPILKNSRILGAVFIHVPSREIQNDVKNIENKIFFLFIIALFISVIGAYFLSSSFTKPILKINTAAKAISNRNYDIRIDVNNKDEIGELASTINQMAQNLCATDKFKRDFIANITHELRTPLSIIKSYAEAINDGILDEKSIKEYSSAIIEEAGRLNNLVNEILELSKLQSGVVKLNYQSIQLKALFDEIINEVSIISGNRKISLNSVEATLRADRELLKRAFSNIVVNAINHTNDSGNITITIKIENGSICISIKDDGKGIKADDLPYIFERFYTTNTKKGVGGLGLSIAKEIIVMHNAEIEVFSIEKKGTEFVIKFSA